MDSYIKAVFEEERIIPAVKKEDEENIGQKILQSINEVEEEEERKNEDDDKKNKREEKRAVEVKIEEELQAIR